MKKNYSRFDITKNFKKFIFYHFVHNKDLFRLNATTKVPLILPTSRTFRQTKELFKGGEQKKNFFHYFHMNKILYLFL